MGDRSVTFSVKVDAALDHLFDKWTGIFLSGDIEALGKWTLNDAVRLEKNFQAECHGGSVWTGSVAISGPLSEIQYRYFIGRRIESVMPPIVQILKWEAGPRPRRAKFDATNTSDHFGKGDSGRITDGWLCDNRTSEIRLSFHGVKCIQFAQPNKSSRSYKISFNVLVSVADQGLSLDEEAMLFTAVTNDEKRRQYRRIYNDANTTELYPADGHELIVFLVQVSTRVENLKFRFCVRDFHSNTVLGIADVANLQRDRTYGAFSVDLMDPDKMDTPVIVGRMEGLYLLTFPSSPSVLKSCTLEKSFASYWKKRPPLDVGHRGMGTSYTKKAKERENTLKSLTTAVSKGADFVEFDVQLSKDLVPILFHDFHVCVDEGGKLKEIVVGSLTLRELSTRKFVHSNALKKEPVLMPVADRDHEAKDPGSRAFPLFKEILSQVPMCAGFNVEIKYPMRLQDGSIECEDFFELNQYVDRIIEVVMEYGKERRVVFSSFCPEICTLLKSKQNRYPVLFLTIGVTKRYPPYVNLITTSSELAIAFALSEGFLGVCFHSDEILTSPQIIQKARDCGLVSFVWGNDFSEKKNIDFMKRIGLDGVIYDRIDELTPGKRNIFCESMECE